MFTVYLSVIVLILIVYILLSLRICKSEDISLWEAFGFSKEYRESKPRSKNVKVASNSFSVKEQIKQLETKLYATDDGDERKRLLNEIRELEQ